jgi:hypothetical protein
MLLSKKVFIIALDPYTNWCKTGAYVIENLASRLSQYPQMSTYYFGVVGVVGSNPAAPIRQKPFNDWLLSFLGTVFRRLSIIYSKVLSPESRG